MRLPSPTWKKSLRELEKEFTLIVQALNLITDLDRSIFQTTLNRDSLMETMLKGVSNLVGAKYAQILLPRGSRLVIAHSTRDEDKGLEFATEECVCGLAVKEGKTVSSGNVAVDFRDRYKWILGRDKRVRMVSEVAVPIYAPSLDGAPAGRVVGVINIESPRPNYFSSREIEFVEKFAKQAGAAMNNARIYAGLELNLKLAANLQATNQQPKDALRDTLKQLAGLFQQEVVIQFLSYEPDSNALVIKSSTVEGTEEKSVLKDDSFSGLAIEQGKAVYSNDVHQEHAKLFKDTVSDAGHYHGDGRRRTRSELAVPIRNNGVIIGVLNVESPEKDAFSEADEYMLTVIASNAGVWTRFYKSKKDLALEKLATVGNVAGHLFHTLDNNLSPLGEIAKELEQIAGSVSPTARDKILSQVEWLRSLAPSIEGSINKLQHMYAREQIPEEGIDIEKVARQVAGEIITRKDIHMVWKVQANMQRLRIPGSIYHVFWNLLSNAQKALDARRKGATITVGIKIVKGQYTRQPEAFELYVKDNGRGMSDKEQKQSLDLDYSSKEGRKGGYGLWWVSTFVDRWEGKIKFYSKVGKGTCVYIRLPLTPESVVATSVGEEKR